MREDELYQEFSFIQSFLDLDDATIFIQTKMRENTPEMEIVTAEIVWVASRWRAGITFAGKTEVEKDTE